MGDSLLTSCPAPLLFFFIQLTWVWEQFMGGKTFFFFLKLQPAVSVSAVDQWLSGKTTNIKDFLWLAHFMATCHWDWFTSDSAYWACVQFHPVKMTVQLASSKKFVYTNQRYSNTLGAISCLCVTNQHSYLFIVFRNECFRKISDVRFADKGWWMLVVVHVKRLDPPPETCIFHFSGFFSSSCESAHLAQLSSSLSCQAAR